MCLFPQYPYWLAAKSSCAKRAAPDLLVQDLSGRCIDGTEGLSIAGTGELATGGKLILDGTLPTASSVATLHLQTENNAPVTQAMLDALPFVPSSVADEIQLATGDVAAQATAHVDLKKNELHYQLNLAFKKTKVYVPALDLPAEGASGSVTIKDGVARIAAVKGNVFGGSFRTEGVVDFHAAAKSARAKLDVAGLDLADLPKEWNIPAVVHKAVANGRLFGSASLEVTIPAELPSLYPATLAAMAGTQGALASGWFSTASLLGPHEEAHVRTRSRGTGEIRDPMGKSARSNSTWQLAPKLSRSRDAAGRADFRTFLSEDRGAETLLAALVMGQTALWRKSPRRKRKPRRRTRTSSST